MLVQFWVIPNVMMESLHSMLESLQLMKLALFSLEERLLWEIQVCNIKLIFVTATYDLATS